MWNIRSHARRFPVHTGTLTPSIAHPNRFLNHLKRFSAGFLTFRGGKAEIRTLWGENSPSLLRRQPALGWVPWHRGKVCGQTAKSAVPEKTVTLSVTAYAVRNSPSHLALLDASLPLLSPSVTSSPGAGEVVLGDGALGMAGKLPDKLQSFRHARGSLSEGAGKTVRF